MSEWNYFVTRLNGDGTETIIERELDLQGVEITDELSGHGDISATISPEIARLKDADGDPILLPYGTAVYAEEIDDNGLSEIRGAAIVLEKNTDDPELSLETAGWTYYAVGQPFTDEFSAHGNDPLELVRMLWTHIQDKPGANIGLRLDTTTSTVRIGKGESAAHKTARLKYEAALKSERTAKLAYDAAVANELKKRIAAFRAVNIRTDDGKILDQASEPTGANRSVKNIWRDSDGDWGVAFPEGPTLTFDGLNWVFRASDGYNEISAALQAESDMRAKKTTWDTAKRATAAAKKEVTAQKAGAGEPYVFGWWQTHDIGGEIDKLADAGNFDYRIEHKWNADGTIDHFLRLGQIGRFRSDLRFVVGENVLWQPPIDDSYENYASEVIVLGAGEGRAMVRGVASSVPKRLYRPKVVVSKGIGRQTTADSSAARLLKMMNGEETIEDITVLDHPHAPIGSYSVGDTIKVETEEGWNSSGEFICRILSITMRPESNLVDISVIQTDKID